MMGTRGLLVCAALAASLVSGAAETVRVLGLDAARPYERGFTRDGDEIVVDNGDDAARRAGAVWSLALNQTEARPFTVRTEARCERGPGGTRTRAFSLYVDLVYMDGDHLWGQTADFAPDPQRGWRAGTVTVIPAKPVRSASVYCLYRGLPGRDLAALAVAGHRGCLRVQGEEHRGGLREVLREAFSGGTGRRVHRLGGGLPHADA